MMHHQTGFAAQFALEPGAVELDVGQAPGAYAKAFFLRSKDRRISPIIKKPRLVKTTKLKVL
jgi:hypothetical protein